MFDRIRTDLALELKDKHIDKNKCDGIVVKECIVEGNIKETTITTKTTIASRGTITANTNALVEST